LKNLSETSSNEKDKESNDKPGFKPTKTPFLDVKNEKKMLEYIKNLCDTNYAKYKTPLKVYFYHRSCFIGGKNFELNPKSNFHSKGG
jgi:hypothetical protein